MTGLLFALDMIRSELLQDKVQVKLMEGLPPFLVTEADILDQ